MSRRDVSSLTTKNIYDQYAEVKVKFDEFKKKEADLKNVIKDKFLHGGLDNYSTDTYKLTMIKTENTSINMEKLIALLLTEYDKSKLISLGVFEEKICVNEERLQELIYEKEIDGALLTSCLEHQAPTYTLRFKEVK